MSRTKPDRAEVRVQIPTADHAAIVELAKQNDRSLTAEVLRAIRAHVARELDYQAVGR